MRGLKPPQKRPRSITALSADLQRLRPPVANQVTGSGTVGQLAKWVGANQLGDGGVGGGGGGGVAGIYWAPPAVPHPDDEEFDGGMSAWTAGGTEIPGGVDPNASFDVTDGDFRADCNVRPSWLRVQASRSSSEVVPYSKAVSLAGDFVAWTRVACIWRNGAANNDALFGLRLFTDAGALAGIYINKDSHETVRGRITVGGVTTFTSAITTTRHASMEWPLMAIQRVGSIVTYWVGTANGAWYPLASQSAFTDDVTSMDMTYRNVVSANPNSVVCVDFIRFLETSEWPL